ncbi:Ras-related small GTP-binding family protein [Striga hermonthica]|uniref:Ras-related small GTP-binding family protein n=1 Tax=Striga hermonthica TaxID=68872 RepID=A0A9N7MTM4_STRHE|nr:Ras-related small GTP-binding family protein [Striga hermonthica]
MTQLCRKIVRRRIVERVAVFRRILRLIWEKIRMCSTGMPHNRYTKLFPEKIPFSPPPSSEESEKWDLNTTTGSYGYEADSDLVSLKVTILGDCHTGKTTFMMKYGGDENEKRSLQMKGLNVMDKIMGVEGATIAFTIWDVGGNFIIGWYSEARKWNQTAIPVLIGTKFDDFVRLPPDIQWTVITQARAYAKAMKATLFFSSATHNINVNKIFKYIIAKLFNLPWTVHRNLTIGEPIIDF